MTMSRKGVLRATAAVAVIAASMTGWQAKAADGQREQRKEDSNTLTEVVVTATKRSVDLQKLPQAVTAITSQQIDDLNAQSFADYFRTVPGLMMNTLRPGVFDFSLRGVSDFSDLVPASAPQRNPTVGQYIDEIPVTAVGQQIDARLVDIERIEVLRGPQGTFFGEDSLGGTIRLITKKPDLAEFSGSVEGRVSATNHGGINDSESLMLNIPVIKDKLAIRANYFEAYDSGFIDTVCVQAPFYPACGPAGSVVQKDYNPNHAKGGRVMALFKPIDRVSILAEYIHSETGSNNSALYDLSLGDLQVQNDYPSSFTEQSDLYNLTANIDFGFASLVSSSSWGDRNGNSAQYGPTGPGGPIGQGGIEIGSNTFAQELRLVSAKEWSDRFDYTLGLYYSHQDVETAGYGGNPTNFDAISKSSAVFGEVGYKVTDRLNFRVGLRQQAVDYSTQYGPSTFSGRNTPTTGRAVVNYTLNDDTMLYASYSKGFRKGGVNSIADRFGNVIPGIPPSFGPDTTTNYELGWKFRTPWRNATFYGAVFHIDWNDIQTVALASIAGLPSPNNVTQYFTNGPAAKVDGIELEGGLDVIEGLRAQASLSLQNPRMTKDATLLPDNPTAVPPFTAPAYCNHGCPARAGDQIPFTAKTTASFTLTYRKPVGGSGLVGFGVLSEQYTGARHTDFAPTWTGPSQTPVLGCPVMVFGPCPVPLQLVPRTVNGDRNAFYETMKSSLLTNLQVGVEKGQLRAALFVDNVFDVRNQDIRTQTDVSVGRPRTIGVFVRQSF